MVIYYEAYYYFKLFDEYLQVIQTNGTIPYPSVLKEDGKKFFFANIKELVFFRDIEVVGEGDDGEEISETTYSCKIKLKDGDSIKIRSLVSKEGRDKKNQVESYREFINFLLEKTSKCNPKFYASSGIISRVNKLIPALKIGGISIASVSIFSVIANILIEMGEYASYFFDSFFAVILGILGIGGLLFSIKRIISKIKKEATLELIQNEYLP